MALVGTHQQGAFTVPVNSTPGNADEVRGNDNTLRGTYNAHDVDAQLHVQMSTLAARPVPGTAERFWVTTDGLRGYVDTGAAWAELAYLPLAAGGSVTGNVSVSGTFTAQGAVTFGTTLSVGATPALSGVLRIPNNSEITARNSTNSADVGLLRLDGTNVLYLGTDTGPGGLNVGIGGGAINLRVASATRFFVTSTETSVLTGAFTVSGTATVSGLLTVNGTIRIANNTALLGRNDANTDDINLVSITVADNVQVGGTAGQNLHFVCGTYGTAWQVEAISGDLHPVQNASVSLGKANLRILDGYFHTSVRIGANPAVTGALRLGNTGHVISRNAANGADIPLIAADVSDAILIGGTASAIAGGMTIGVPTATGIRLQVAATNRLVVDGSGITVTGTGIFSGTVTASTFSGSGASLTALPAGQLTGTVPSGTVSGSYTGITAVGTLTSLTVSGTSTLARADVTRLIGTRVTSTSAATSLAIDASAGTIFEWTASRTNGLTYTWSNPTNPVAGQVIHLIFDNTAGSGACQVEFGSAFRENPLSGSVNATTMETRTFYYDGTNWIQIGAAGVLDY